MRQVVLYTKPGCCLCDTVKAQLVRLQAVELFSLAEVNILDDHAAFAKFQTEIPIVFINGHKAFQYHLDETDFLRWLRAQPPER